MIEYTQVFLPLADDSANVNIIANYTTATAFHCAPTAGNGLLVDGVKIVVVSPVGNIKIGDYGLAAATREGVLLEVQTTAGATVRSIWNAKSAFDATKTGVFALGDYLRIGTAYSEPITGSDGTNRYFECLISPAKPILVEDGQRFAAIFEGDFSLGGGSALVSNSITVIGREFSWAPHNSVAKKALV